MNIIGERIKEIRKERGINQEDLAKSLGISKATISRYESGSREPKSEQLKKIANELHVTVAYLQGEESRWSHSNFSASDLETAEKMEAMFNLPRGSVHILTEDEMRLNSLENGLKKKISDLFKAHRPDISETFYNSILRIMDNVITLNDTGCEKAVERISELAEISRYKK